MNGNNVASTAVAFSFSAALGFVVAYIVWPWAGPMLVRPTPLPTLAGCICWSLFAGLRGVGSYIEQRSKQR